MPADVGVYDSNPNREESPPPGLIHWCFDPPIWFVSEQETVYQYNTWMIAVSGAESLWGKYTAIQPKVMYSSPSSDSNVCFALLQSFRREELEEPGAVIRFLRSVENGAAEVTREVFCLPPDQLSQYLIYEDDAVMIYDFFDLTGAPALEEQLKEVSCQQGLDELGISLDWATVLRDTLKDGGEGGLGRFIRPDE